MSTRSYAIIGTGALGGYYGGRLAHAGMDTHFLLRSDYEHVRAHGLRIDSVQGNFLLPSVQAYRDPADLPACDVAVVCLKSTQNDVLAELLPKVVKPDGVVLVLENGLHPERDAAAVVGADRVLGGLCFLCSNKIGPGHIDHQDFGHIDMGRLGETPGLEAIVADFNDAGIQTRAVEDLTLSRWRKLVWNVPYNGLSVVLNATTDQLMDNPASLSLVEQLMQEVVTAAERADGRVIDPAFVQQMLDYTRRMTPYKTSMMLDYEAGRALEVEAIFGAPLRAAQAAGYEPPALHTLYRQLLFVNEHQTGN